MPDPRQPPPVPPRHCRLLARRCPARRRGVRPPPVRAHGGPGPLRAGRAARPWRGRRADHNTEAYDRIDDNPFLAARDNPLSTFSIDVDTASYANVRRFLRDGHLPPPDAVRIEELVNYFRYDYPAPRGRRAVRGHDRGRRLRRGTASTGWCASACRRATIAPRTGAARATWCSWSTSRARWTTPNKLPLLKRVAGAARRAARGAGPHRDRGLRRRVGLVLPPTSGADARAHPRRARPAARPAARPTAPTGIELAYRLARAELRAGRHQPRDPRDRRRLQRRRHQPGRADPPDRGEARAPASFLTVLGFGTGNLKDSTMEKLADKGNGNYAYIDSLAEARKVLVERGGAARWSPSPRT